MQQAVHWIPIYNSARNLAAFLGYPYLFNTAGKWIGFVNADGEVFDIYGKYVGYLDPNPSAPRILRDLKTADSPPPAEPPPPPTIKPVVGMTVPLPPMMPKPPKGTVDVFLHAPHLLRPAPFGGRRER